MYCRDGLKKQVMQSIEFLDKAFEGRYTQNIVIMLTKAFVVSANS